MAALFHDTSSIRITLCVCVNVLRYVYVYMYVYIHVYMQTTRYCMCKTVEHSNQPRRMFNQVDIRTVLEIINDIMQLRAMAHLHAYVATMFT